MTRRWLLLLALLVLCLPAAAGRRDPLNDKEIDEMREIAQQGDKRLRLLLSFARRRMNDAEQLQRTPKDFEGRGQRLHDELEDFTTLVDEVGSNIDQYAGQKQDIRKPLREIIEADLDFQTRLGALQTAAAAPENATDAKDWHYVLEDAIDAVADDLDNARHTLEEQNQLAKAKQLHKPG
jgi:hypothetical protein